MNTATISSSTTLPDAKKVGMVSLGCPKALVDSERILTRLRADGYAMSADYAGADVVLVYTCGFLDSAKEESLAAIGEAIAENGRVIVTGCMGDEAEAIRREGEQRRLKQGPSSSSSSESPGRTLSTPRGEASEDKEAQRESEEGQVAVRGRDRATSAPTDILWIKFDVAGSLCALRGGSNAARRCILRKLHLRWWHAASGATQRTLRAAGFP